MHLFLQFYLQFNPSQPSYYYKNMYKIIGLVLLFGTNKVPITCWLKWVLDTIVLPSGGGFGKHTLIFFIKDFIKQSKLFKNYAYIFKQRAKSKILLSMQYFIHVILNTSKYLLADVMFFAACFFLSFHIYSVTQTWDFWPT